MEPSQAIAAIKSKFGKTGSSAEIPLLRRRKGKDCFTATLLEHGIDVGNLAAEPLLPWEAFEEAVKLMTKGGGSAKRGAAQNFKLGKDGLPLDLVEGHVASAVYKKREGDSVFRRITPIACVLIWAGICKPSRGKLHLVQR